jgi:hypothetical protein
MRPIGNRLIGIGFALVLVGLIFWHFNWPDMFRGRISGFVVMGIGVVVRVFGKKREELESLSSLIVLE